MLPWPSKRPATGAPEHNQGGLQRCPDARAVLPAYVERELTPAETARVARHLEICGSCRREETELRAALGALNAPRQLPDPGDLYAGFAAKLAATERKSRGFGMQLRLAATAACLLLVVAVGAKPLAAVVSRLLAPAQPAAVAKSPAPAPIAPSPSSDSEKVAVAPPTVPTVDPGPTQPTAEVQPEPAGKEAPRQSAENPPEVRNRPRHEDPTDFASVRDRDGNSLNDLIRRRRQAVGTGRFPAPHEDTAAPPALGPNGAGPMIADRDDRVRVGNSELRVRTGYREDAEGRRVSISVNMGSATVADE